MSDVSLPVHTGAPVSSISSDLLIGGTAIALYLFGDGTPQMRRRVFNLAKASRMPCFRMGGRICARKSELEAWLRSKKRE